MNEKIKFLCYGIGSSLLAFDIFQRHQIRKELKDIKANICQGNFNDYQNHTTEMNSINNLANVLYDYKIDKLKEEAKQLEKGVMNL